MINHINKLLSIILPIELFIVLVFFGQPTASSPSGADIKKPAEL